MEDNIRIAVLSAYDKVCTFLDNSASDAMHYYSDELHMYLKGSANTYTFKTSTRHPDAVYLSEGNKLAFNHRGKDYYLNIMKVTRTEYEVEIEAYSLNFELLNEQKEAYKAASAMSFAQYLDVFDFEKVVTLGINEVSDKRITNEWTGTETMLARIFSLANVFDAEAEFVPELNPDYSLKRIILNVYKEHTDTVQGVGTNRTDITLRYGKNVSGITKTSDITDLYTAIRPIGNDGLTVSALDKTEYDAEGRVEYQCPKGKRNIYAVQARDRFPSNLMANENERYIAQVWEYDTDNVNTLYGQALAELKKNCVPQVTYEVDGYFDTDIGDTVSIADEEYNPPLYLQARVTEQQRSFTDPTQNKTTFSNCREMQSQIDPALLQKMNDLIDANKVYACSVLSDNGIVFKNGKGSTALTASAMDVGKDMADSLTIKWFVDNAELATGKSITVNAADISGKAVYRFEATDGAGVLRGSAEVTVANVDDGANGKPGAPGADAYTLYLSTSSSVFNADFDGNLTKNISVSTAVVAFKGTTQLTPVIGTLPDVSGFAFSLSGTTITITGKKGGDMADNGVINIPVTVDGIACTLTFTYAKVKDGYHGENAKLCTVTGNQIMKYASGSTTPEPASLTLTATYQNTNHSRWQYLNEYGVWADFAPSETKTSVTIAADSAAWVGNTATIRAVDTTGIAMDTTTLAKLRDGEQGKPGKPGADVATVDVEYYLSTSATSLEGGTWQTAAPTWTEGKYIWTRTKTTLSDGKETLTDPVNITGSKGQTGGTGTGVASITEEYYLSTSKTAQTGGSWSEKPPTWSSGKYVWTRSRILYKDPTSTAYTVPVCDSSWEAVNEVQVGGRNLIVGSSDATIGPQWSVSGWQGRFSSFDAEERTYKTLAINGWRSANYHLAKEYDGKQVTISLTAKLDSAGTTSTAANYLYVDLPAKTANAAKNTAAFFLKDDGSVLEALPVKDKWIRLHATATVNNTSIIGIGAQCSPEQKNLKTTWFVKDLKVEIGNKATDWTPAPEDIQGQIDRTVINVDVEYYLSTSATALEGGTWQTTAPAWMEGKYIWTRTKKTYADSSVKYTDPTCITGATGKGIKKIEEQYYLSTSATSLTGGEWQATAPAWADGKYTWTRSAITYTDKSTETTSPICVSGGKGDTGPAGTGYTVLLSNESYTFAAGTSAALAGSTDTGVTAYKNTAQVAATVTKIGSTAVTGNASGVATGFAGLTAAVSQNGTAGCKVTFTAAATLTTKNGSVPISITVDGRTFVKDFSFSLALKGDTGSAGDKGDPTGVVESATEPGVKYVGMLWKNVGASPSYIKDSIYRWTGTAWELFQFSAENINANTFTGYAFNGAYISGGIIEGESQIEIQKQLTAGSFAGDTVWDFINEDGISVRQFSTTSVLRGEVSITPFDIHVLGTTRTFRGVNNALNELDNKFASGKTGLIGVNGGSYVDTYVSFGKNFGYTPLIFLTFNAGSANVKYLGLAYFNESSTGMTVRVSNSGSGRYSVYVTWMAVG